MSEPADQDSRTLMHLADTAEKRHAAQMQEWLADPEYRAFLHKHDQEMAQ